jgi:hypothetical protein
MVANIAALSLEEGEVSLSNVNKQEVISDD